jgi:hypothetical protein
MRGTGEKLVTVHRRELDKAVPGKDGGVAQWGTPVDVNQRLLWRRVKLASPTASGSTAEVHREAFAIY